MNFKKVVKKYTPGLLLDFYYWIWALVGAIIFWFPSRKLIVIGVTGTSGKSTTVDFITRILEQAHSTGSGQAGNNVASISSARFKIGNKEWKNDLKMTMPGRFKIQKFLRQAVREKCKYMVLEVTSEGIKQYRHKFINFNTAVFTNLSPEHIESHGGFENYRNEKLKLFKVTKNVHIINIADDNSDYFWSVDAHQKIGFKIKNQNAKIKITNQKQPSGVPAGPAKFMEASDVEVVADSLSFTIQDTKFKIQLLGEFNVYNALAAISVALSENISLDICKKALEKISLIPGRMEIVSNDPFVVVDYAHTPEQLESVYKTLSQNPLDPQGIPAGASQISNPKYENYSLPTTNYKLICVLGSCGGGRDMWKRPVLGQIAKKYCKEIIITNEDPYDEPPMEIINQVAEGAGDAAIKILDRREAIKKALSLAKKDEAVIITGKGSESLMCLSNNQKIPWDDREIVRQELKKIFTP